MSQFSAMGAGAISAFPVITDALWNKMPEEKRSNFEEQMKNHVLNNAFTDVAINKTTITEKFDLKAGENYFKLYKDQYGKTTNIAATWEPEVNPGFFPAEGVGQIDDKKGFSLARMKVEFGNPIPQKYVVEHPRKKDNDIER